MQFVRPKFLAYENGFVLPVSSALGKEPGIDVSAAGRNPADAILAAARLGDCLRQSVTAEGFSRVPFVVHGDQLEAYGKKTRDVVLPLNIAENMESAYTTLARGVGRGERLVASRGYLVELARDNSNRLEVHFPPRPAR